MAKSAMLAASELRFKKVRLSFNFTLASELAITKRKHEKANDPRNCLTHLRGSSEFSRRQEALKARISVRLLALTDVPCREW